jgi:hypothetical protein
MTELILFSMDLQEMAKAHEMIEHVLLAPRASVSFTTAF